MTYAKEGA